MASAPIPDSTTQAGPGQELNQADRNWDNHDVTPDDSISHVGRHYLTLSNASASGGSGISRASSSARQAKATQIKLSAKLKAFQSKRDLETKLQKLEMHKKAIEQEEQGIRQMQAEIDMRAEYEAATAVHDMLVQDEESRPTSKITGQLSCIQEKVHCEDVTTGMTRVHRDRLSDAMNRLWQHMPDDVSDDTRPIINPETANRISSVELSPEPQRPPSHHGDTGSSSGQSQFESLENMSDHGQLRSSASQAQIRPRVDGHTSLQQQSLRNHPANYNYSQFKERQPSNQEIGLHTSTSKINPIDVHVPPPLASNDYSPFNERPPRSDEIQTSTRKRNPGDDPVLLRSASNDYSPFKNHYSPSNERQLRSDELNISSIKRNPDDAHHVSFPSSSNNYSPFNNHYSSSKERHPRSGEVYVPSTTTTSKRSPADDHVQLVSNDYYSPFNNQQRKVQEIGLHASTIKRNHVDAPHVSFPSARNNYSPFNDQQRNGYEIGLHASTIERNPVDAHHLSFPSTSNSYGPYDDHQSTMTRAGEEYGSTVGRVTDDFHVPLPSTSKSYSSLNYCQLPRPGERYRPTPTTSRVPVGDVPHEPEFTCHQESAMPRRVLTDRPTEKCRLWTPQRSDIGQYYSPAKATHHHDQDRAMPNHEFRPGNMMQPPEPISFSALMQQQNEITRLLVKQQVRSSLPPLRIPKFSGDPLRYTAFIKAFEYGIESKTENFKDRLNFLDEYTEGGANGLVKSCLHFTDPREGFEKAKGLLNKRYGNSHNIAEAFLKKAENWSDIRRENAAELSKFSLFLTECRNMVDSIDALHELNHSKCIKMLVSKLPFNLRSMWRNTAFTIEEEQHKTVAFAHLVEFVDRQSRIASNPTFGVVTDDKRDNGSSKRTSSNSTGKDRRKAFATDIKEDKTSKRTCLYCEGDNHNILKCKKFETLNAKKKSVFCFQNNLCFACLQKGHMKSNCSQKDSIKCSKCSGKHPTVLHSDNYTGSKRQSPSKQTESQPEVSSGCVGVLGAGTNVHDNSSPTMAIIPVRVKVAAGHECISTYAFLDNGCGGVFIDSELCHSLNVRTRERSLLIKTLNLEEVLESSVSLDKLQVGDMVEDTFIDLPEAYVKDDIPVGLDDMVVQDDLEEWSHLSHLQLPNLQGWSLPKISLMIGSNVPAATMPLDTITSIPGEPYAIKTPLGWVVYGILGKPKDQVSVNFCKTHGSVIQDGLSNLEEQFRNYVNMDFNEKTAEETAPSLEDKQFLKFAEDTCQYQQGHYQMGLPLRHSSVMFPDNYRQAKQRIDQLKRRFMKDPIFKDRYTAAMTEALEKGYAEQVPDSQKHRQDGRVWFIPHHGVYQPVKQKMRIVYDCAAECEGTSLNKELLQGPDLTNGLLGVLMRFRQSPIAVKADIEAMFYQVHVRPDDRDLMRFLWWPGGDLTKDIEEYRMTVHVFGAVCSPSCANYVLLKTACDNAGSCEEEVVEAVKRNFYVDDFCVSTKKEDEAKALSRGVKDLLAKGGFRLTKWVSNNREVLSSLPKEEWAKPVKNLRIDEEILPRDRTLGVLWCMESDTFRFEINLKDREPTRRGILSVISSVYDPMGMVCAAIMPAKLLLQDSCRLRLGWDDEIPQMFKGRWIRWLADLPKLESISVDRCLMPRDFWNPASVQLHHFADASNSGYGVITYLRLVNESGDVHCSFVCAKSRVAPIKQISIPRMELTAATVAVRINNMLMKELTIPIDDVHFWTDSTTVIKYINNETSRFRTFVANRLTEIRDNSQPSQWKYVKSEDNPGDECSRGLSIDKFIANQRWFRGPEFLWDPEGRWPSIDLVLEQYQNDPEEEEEKDVEVKRQVHIVQVSAPDEIEEDEDKEKRMKGLVHEMQISASDVLEDDRDAESRVTKAVHSIQFNAPSVLVDEDAKDEEVERSSVSVQANAVALFDGVEPQSAAVSTLIKYYSSWNRCRRAVAWWMRLKKILRSRSKGHGVQATPKHLTLEEIQMAEVEIVKYIQKEAFSQEIMRLQSGRMLDSNCEILKLDPIFSDGLLRVGGRLHKATIPEEAKHQLILPRHHQVTELILKHIHSNFHHQGKNHLLAEFRQKYWVNKLGPVVKSLIKRCIVCQKHRSKILTQKMSDLPASRVKCDEPPFSYVGMDYFGPFEIKEGRSVKKRYGVIFTCMSSRAVHIEIASSMDTSSCINAVRRFLSRRGTVKEIKSDNGSNLEEMDVDDIQRFSVSRGIEWSFNPPGASHHGGVWERQIRTIRKLLQAVLEEQHLKVAKSEEQLNTLLCEIEKTINSRPLTRSSDDHRDLEVLTPNHLLQLKTPEALPPGKFEKKDNYVRRRWRQVQYIADLYWKRWAKEYLTTLQERQKWLQPTRNVKVGDIVLVVDSTAPRNSWPMGRVENVNMGNQGCVRSVSVRTKSTLLTRPISKLCMLLEADDE